MPAAEITFEVPAGRPAAGLADDVQALHDQVCASLPYGRDLDTSRLAGPLRVQVRQPGFALAEARSGGYLIGCAAGVPLRPSTSWWRELTAPLPENVTAEHPGRTFALTELLVRAPWRRQGIGRSLHELILAGRPEKRATLVLPATAAGAQIAFQNWGWRKIARTRGPDPGSPALDVLLIELPARRDL